MGFLDEWVFGGGARDRAVRAVKRGVEEGRGEAALDALDALSARRHGQALVELTRWLLLDDHVELLRAGAERLRGKAPGSAELAKVDAELRLLTESLGEAIERLQGELDENPRVVEVRARLVECLVEAGRAEEALRYATRQVAAVEPLIAQARAEALIAVGQDEEALRLLDRVAEVWKEAMQSTFSSPEWQVFSERRKVAMRLRDEARARLHGREAVTLQSALDRDLDPRAGVNFKLLGAAMMDESTHAPPTWALETPEQTADRPAEGALALVYQGIARFRRGKVEHALELFEQARAADPRLFPAWLGVGACRTAESRRWHRRAESLPDATFDEAWAAIVPDLPAMTDAERRVVWASARPLRALRHHLARTGAVIRVLAIDARVTDVPALGSLAGERHAGDHRAWSAIGGLASDHHGLAVARIEDLLDLDHATFAHELAHLAFFRMPGALRLRVRRLRRFALEHPYACGDYELSDVHEFFAVAYQQWLAKRHGRDEVIEDEAGVRAAVHAFFDRIDALDELPTGRVRLRARRPRFRRRRAPDASRP